MALLLMVARLPRISKSFKLLPVMLIQVYVLSYKCIFVSNIVTDTQSFPMSGMISIGIVYKFH